MSNLFASTVIKGNRLTDLSVQTSTVGKPIPFGSGRVPVEEANIIWTAGIPKERKKKKKQGKGGVKSEEYTYSLSYAIGFMRGPVNGFITIKRGGKVVYTTDPDAPVEDKNYAAKWKQKVRFYLGTETQLPDATIESYVGVGRVSAFRGLCYIVVVDDDVTPEGGAVPQYTAVIRATDPDAFVTSHPYVVAMPDEMALDYGPVEVFSRQILQEVYDADEVTLDYGARLVFLKDQYNNTFVDDTFNFSYGPINVTLTSPFKATATQPDSMSFAYSAAAVNLKQALIVLETSKEELSLTFSAVGVTLT